MSSRAKGRRSLNDVIDWFIDNGYIVDESEQGGKFRKYKDLYAGYCLNCHKREDDCCDNPHRFSGFDLVALKGKHVVLCQVKTNRKPNLSEYSKFAKKYASRNIKIWSITKFDYKGLVIDKFYSDGQIKTIDLRK